MAAARRIPSAPAAAQPVFPDEILEEIFLRLDAAADLARTSAACSSFLHVISARRFLRRFRSFHPPPVLGLLYGYLAEHFFPAEQPHRSASAARALARAADFTFSFLPGARCWQPRDCRDGRVLLSECGAYHLVVCDPLHRRYAMIPPIPDDLSVPIPQADMNILEPFLAPASEYEDGKLKDEEESSFRVICTVRSENKFMAFFFSSVNQKWELITYHRSSYFGFRRCYAHGCFFWQVDLERYMVMLDTREMKFSNVDLPPNYDALNSAAIVEIGKGRIGLLTLGDSTIDLSCKIWRTNGVGTEGWRHYKMIPLPKDSDGFYYSWFIMGAAERYVSLLRSESGGNVPMRTEYFVLDLKTMLLEKLCVFNQTAASAHLYASFPPPLAPPSL
ncbi:unnamed protein product [Urochloa humidicola]